MMVGGNVLKGIGLVAGAVFLFALGDVLTKHLAMAYSVALVVAVRNLVNVALLAVVLGPREGVGLWRTRRTGLVILRGLALAAASLTMGLALRVMPVGETVAIVYLSPFAVMLLAGPILGERVAVWAWVFASLGFLGVLLIARPGGGLDPLGVVLSLVNAGCATGYHLLTRVLSRTETTPALLFHTALVGLLVFGVMTLAEGGVILPGRADLAAMVALGVLATGGHFLFTAAYREAPASVLAPVNYLHLAWAGLLGWLVFGHLPDLPGGLGMALVALAGVAVAIAAHRAKTRTIMAETVDCA